ncbi:disease resistance protein Pik-2-like [Phragmites australis]|uniref:disease resistance protein Pik-2-like n=1 Tax=Phragmites australis TaxID=29695 RepID=UPI002D78F4AF|nr:disease resistance protein Pik-2-like [Phragmites australis]
MDIVVGALSDMVDALPEKLGELLEQECALLAGVRGDVGFLQSELKSMRAAIHHCESLDHPDTQTSAWVGRVRELAYDIEDWVDLFAIRVDDSGTQSSSGFRAWIRRGWDKVTKLPDRHVIANELQELKKRVVELSEQRNRYSCALPFPAEARPTDPRLTALFVDPGSLVGLDGPVEEVSKLVMDDGGRTELKIVSIVGMAGAGKTTLANAVYRRPEAQNTFPCRAFVSVGQKPNMLGKTLTDMLAQISGRHCRGEDINQLIVRVREILDKKRYLIVVDDLWSSQQWGTIRCCFPENNLGSRILTTTRNDALPTDYYSSKFVHKVGLLSDADAKELFLKKAFGNGHGCPQHLEDVFAQVMRRCGGLPLAVVSRAGMLAHKQSRNEWERLELDSLCSSHPDGSDGVKQILNLSYNDLAPHLRTCLLYLSIFPENSEVDTERLVRRWIAEGFIAEARGGSTEETARSYLIELIGRNLVQPLDLNRDGVPRRCRVHPVIHDFIVCKSMEENFSTLVDAQHHNAPTSNGTVRRMSLQNSIKQDKSVARNEPTDLSHARSVTVFGQGSGAPRLTDLKVVRVLDLEDCSGPVCLDGLCDLLLLRYLSLRGTGVSELPEQIGELRCLGTLDVRSTQVKELPRSILRLEKLIHLLAGSAKLPDGIAKMKALQTLSSAGTTNSSVNVNEEISELASLRELELFCDLTEMLGSGVTFPRAGFRSLMKLCIRCSSPSVTFEPDALPMVQELELRFEKGLADESSGVSGIEHLSSLKHVLLEFSQHDAGAMATVSAVRNATNTVHPNRPEVTVNVDGKSY